MRLLRGVERAIAHFTQCRYTVCLPLNGTQAYDLVVDDGHGLLTVSVKTTAQRAPSGNYEVELRTKGGSRNHNRVDSLFVITEEGKAYWITREAIGDKRILTLNDKMDAYLVTR